ncbi:SDR family oxidoreductase (plasmid) [Rhodococcus sp. USK10]|nr:SDR family oxidoreductase [Rhodococcus sp. USK10]
MTLSGAGGDQAGRTVLITGAAKGLGAAVTRRCLRDGYTPVLLDRDLETLKSFAHELSCEYHHLDITDIEQIPAVVDAVARSHGSLYGLVNNAGINRPAPGATMPAHAWNSVIEVNLNGTFFMSQAVYPHLQEQSSIVNLGSILSARGTFGRAAYTATKAAITALTKVLAVEWAGRGIRVNAVARRGLRHPLCRTSINWAGSTSRL